MRGQRLVFVQFYISRTNYHARTDWLQHHIKLVTRVPANFQQKTNLALSDRLDPQNFLVFSAQTRYTNGASSVLFLILCLGNKFNNGNPIEINKYRISETNQTIIVIITINNTYLSIWCTTIPNNYPVPV